MPIRSPDALLVDLFDRALGRAQERGVPLPRSLHLLLGAHVGCFVFAGATALAHGIVPVAGVMLAFAAGLSLYFREQRAGYRRDAVAWSPEKAERYRALAAWNRERLVLYRVACLVMLLAILVAVIDGMGELPIPVRGLALALTLPIVLAGATFVAHLYAACAMPRDTGHRTSNPLGSAAGI